MKVFIVVLSAVIATVLANGYGGGYESSAYGGSHSYAVPIVSKVVNVNSGWSNQYRKQDGWTYAFGYDEQHNDAWGSGGSSRHEKSDAWNNKEGTYSLNVGDGRQRVVKYVADGAGFRASIKTNEPGIVASNPASVNINTPNHGGYEQQQYSSYSQPAPVVTHVGGYTQEGSSYGGNQGGYESSSGY